MEYRETITLKDGRTCILRNGTEKDGKAVLDNFILTHEQTDNLLSYPDESDITAEQEAQFLKNKTESSCEIEMVWPGSTRWAANTRFDTELISESV